MQQTRPFFISAKFYISVLLTYNQLQKYCYLLYQICSGAFERIFGVLSLLDRRGTKHSTSYHIPIYQHTMGKLNNRVKSKKLTIFPWILTWWSRPKTVPKTLKIKRKIKKWQILKNAKNKNLEGNFQIYGIQLSLNHHHCVIWNTYSHLITAWGIILPNCPQGAVSEST